jgi:hypothetical protein
MSLTAQSGVGEGYLPTTTKIPGKKGLKSEERSEFGRIPIEFLSYTSTTNKNHPAIAAANCLVERNKERRGEGSRGKCL